MGKIVALDIGVASVGWAVVDRETENVIEACSNIFPEANAAKNAERRMFREGRRLKRRQRTRLDDFKKVWKKNNLDIPEVFDNEVVRLRKAALTEEISLEQLYMILYYYLKHRGIDYLEDADDSGTVSGAYANGLAINQKELELKFPCEIQLERLEKYGKFRGQNEIQLDNGDLADISNVFTVSSYIKEIITILNTQKTYHSEISDSFINEYLLIFKRKRKYYEGPGTELSRTDYGIYTTKIDSESGEYIIEKNIFEKLIGKCSVYPDELRASAASYTAQEFNILNDLNNLRINGRILEKQEKFDIVSKVKTANAVNMKRIIEDVIGDSIDEMTGNRIDKDGKAIFHSFEVYNKMRRELRNIDVDITTFSRDELDEIGYILTINTDRLSITEAFNESTLCIDDKIIDCFVSLRKKASSLFNRWHSFSIKIMNKLIPEMYEQPKEQMTLLTEMGLFRSNSEEFIGLKYIPVDAVSDKITNPVVRRSVRIAIRVTNALIKKYKDIDEIVIEMPRDANSAEKDQREKDMTKINEKEMADIEKKLAVSYGFEIKPEHFASQKRLALKLKLWNEQDGICLYSGKEINPIDIINHPDLFQIDHIIPISISLDDSRANKVLVYESENQKKGNQTPYFYIINRKNDRWTFDHLRAKTIDLSKKKEYGISKKKVQNLLFMEDITKHDVQQGFLSRNLNDTRYASRVILNTMQSFFRTNNMNIKVKVIRGSFTHQMRVNMKLDKNRQESYSHHAVDAMLIAYSQMGYDAYCKLQGKFIDFETGEILNEKMWQKNMTKEVYQQYLYGMKWTNIRNNISNAEVKYWHYVDKKFNRGLCNQTIRGTIEVDGKIYKINKLNIRTKDGYSTFKKLAFDEKKRERLLVYKNDRKTFDDLITICKDYSDATNPFIQYEKETGDCVRKHSKKHNGPKIISLKYIGGEVGTCIDISHKYGYEKGSKKVILEHLNPYRMDVYKDKKTHEYRLIGIKQSDVKCENGRYFIDDNAYKSILVSEKMLMPEQKLHELSETYEFVLSFYRGEIIQYEKNSKIYTELFWSRTKNRKNNIETKPIDKLKFKDKDQNQFSLSKTTLIRKIRQDILGNMYICEKETFTKYCDDND
ncbi:MAG: type II CRISPR RNA-guided endonuclease Cas9 [Lachnospiraceae bacterium]|nr:type II CRISPR RNA-guided endonuclease Cas9 [Lachnospiraceae bacterium]